MNSLMLIVLGMAALFFFQIGFTFLAFLVLIVLVVMLLSNTQSAGAAGHGGGHLGGGANPYVINQTGSVWPSKTKFEFRPNYPGDPDGEEWISGKAGQWFLFFGNAAKSILGMGRDSHAQDEFYKKYSH